GTYSSDGELDDFVGGGEVQRGGYGGGPGGGEFGCRSGRELCYCFGRNSGMGEDSHNLAKTPLKAAQAPLAAASASQGVLGGMAEEGMGDAVEERGRGEMARPLVGKTGE
ncbi:MAG: hypothetical protein Q9228_006936, partial [Teloschistes exilis]